MANDETELNLELMLQSATLRSVEFNPLAYVRDLLARLPMLAADDHVRLDALLPDRWIQENSERRLQHRERESRRAAQRRRDRRARQRRLAAAQVGSKRK